MWALTRSVRRSASLSVLSTFGILGTAAFAQSATRTLTGVVTDGHHEPLRGAIVEVEDPARQTVRSYITDTTGRYTFLRLDGNTDYTVWATVKGRQSKHKVLSQFDMHRVKVLNFKVRPE